ncbi:MAG: hypothetical protein WDW36_009411 [Sanguina aurantia]
MSKTKNFNDETSWDRWNTHASTSIEQEVLGTVLHLQQDPSSEHLGTTVWDASIVMAKYFEKNLRKGEFARSKLRGKRAIEIGAGMGLGGLAFAMMGADVIITDTTEVLPMLRRNYERNLSPAAINASGCHGTWADSVGKVVVAELDWTVPEQVAPLLPPFDYVLAADCIYHEHITEDFHRTVMDLTNEKSTVVVVNELRSESVHSRFMELFTATHTMKKVPHAKMDPQFQHPNIMIYILRKRKPAGGAAGGAADPEDGDADEDAEDDAPEAPASKPSKAPKTLKAGKASKAVKAVSAPAAVVSGASSVTQQQQQGEAPVTTCTDAAVERVTERFQTHSLSGAGDGSSLPGGSGSSSSMLPESHPDQTSTAQPDQTARQGPTAGLGDQPAAVLLPSPALLKVLSGQSEGSAWEARRAGFEAARMMGAVSVPSSSTQQAAPAAVAWTPAMLKQKKDRKP